MARYANNSNYRNDSLIRKESKTLSASLSPASQRAQQAEQSDAQCV
jgi:hypothetical protein